MKKSVTKSIIKSINRFNSTNKINDYNRGGKKIQKQLSKKLKYKNNKCHAWISAVSILSLIVSHSPPHLFRMPSEYWTGLWTCCSGSSSDSNLVLVLYVLASVSTSAVQVCFLLWELSLSFYIFHRHKVCLVDFVYLICSLYHCGKVWGSLP